MNHKRLKLACVSWIAALACQPATQAAVLSANLAPVPPATVVDLSSVGKLDWAQWGLNPSNQFNQKIGPGLISNFSVIGAATAIPYVTNLNGYSWSDGQPVSTVTNATTGMLVAGLTNGFLILVPAETITRRLKLYVGVNAAQATLQADLSDSSAPPYNDTSLDGGLNTSNAVYTLNYAAASGGQTLAVRFTVSALYDPAGSVTLQAATLATNSPPAVTLIQPTNNQVLPSQGNITLQASASDIDGTIAMVEFFQGGIKLGDTNGSPYSIVWSNVVPGLYS